MYKTSICIQFTKGKCQDGDFCRYAHGSNDQRRIGSNEERERIDRPLAPQKSAVFDEDKLSHEYREERSAQKKKPTFNVYNLRKIVHSSDYDDEAKDEQKMDQYDPVRHRYNYLNPFYFYSLNNFPVYYPVTINQTMPFFNYISINNSNGANEGSKKISEDSSRFNSKSSDECKMTIVNGKSVSNSFSTMIPSINTDKRDMI